MDAFDNPFFLIKATPRDNKSRLMELAEEAALHGDADAAAHARSVLTNPRNRLAAEVAWFPGMAPRRVEDLLRAIREGAAADEPGEMPPLCRANLELAALSAGAGRDPARLRAAIRRVAEQVDALQVPRVMLAINEDRQASGFPQVTDAALVEQEIAERCRHYQRVLTGLLDDLPTAAMVEAYERLIAESSADGQQAPPRLVNDLLAAYELHAGDFLGGEAERILQLVEATRAAADRKAPAQQVRQSVHEIIGAIADWDRVAQPIQLVRKSRGLDHEDSKRLAFRARSLAVHLFNEHDYLQDAKLLSDALKRSFAEVAAVNDLVEEDVRSLDRIEAERLERQARAEREKAQFAAEVTYETTFGMIFKDRFRISPEGIEYKGRLTPIEKISGVAWGAVRHITNGRETGTSYHFRWGAEVGLIELVIDTEAQNKEIIPRAWRAICVPILLRMMETWRAGGSVQIGGHEVRDGGIVLKHARMFKADELRFFAWNDMSKGAHQGMLNFFGRPEKEFTASLSYRDVLNVHILDFAVDRIWQGKADRLSRIFEG